MKSGMKYIRYSTTLTFNRVKCPKQITKLGGKTFGQATGGKAVVVDISFL